MVNKDEHNIDMKSRSGKLVFTLASNERRLL